ncbi:HD domain-containing protein [bacterium]|nr:MAG: HD domain-containing protein [bacterium]
MNFKDTVKGMFTSKLAALTTIFGWIVVVVYILYDYKTHFQGAPAGAVVDHFLHNDNYLETIFHILVLSAPIGSTITGYLISNRKQLLDESQLSERKLKHASNEWRNTFDSMPYGIILTDGDYNVIRANHYISDYAGYPLKELIFNKKCYEVLMKRDTPCYGCPLEKVKKTKCKVTTDLHDASNDGYYMENVAPMYSYDGNILAYVHSVIDVREGKEKEKQLVQAKDAFFNMLKDLDSTYKELKDIYNNLVIAFSNVIDAKSPWTKGHSVNVTTYAVAIAESMGLSEEDIFILRTAALLHDIGKIGTYDKILDKEGKLTDEEFALIRQHPKQGVKILEPIKGLESVLPVIRHHHERLDGRGYPDGLKGEEISLLARILCVADSYDAMLTSRPYRNSTGKDYAMDELKRCSGSQFDPQVVDVFLGILESEKHMSLN